jgi:hypothetical protein
MKKILFSTLLLFTTSSFSLETDQFIASNIILKDSSEIMNQYFSNSIQKSLESINASSKLSNSSCQNLAYKVMEDATGKYSISKASSFASSSKEIERFPRDSVSERGYIRNSFYQHAWLPLQVVQLARTININGIYLGTDKFGHFTRMGMNYYKTYLKLIQNGTSKKEAIEKAIINGFGSEYGILGYGIGGVLSYGDLEANYQGFMFALDMCQGVNPILTKVKNLWVENPNHLFDLKNYFGPKMDESYNLSFWRKPLYRKIENKLHLEYCESRNSVIFKERILFYNQIIQVNLNDRLIRENILTQSKYDRKLENLEIGCDN